MADHHEGNAQKQALDALNGQRYEDAAIMFHQLYQCEEEDSDRHLTHACVAIWMGVQRYCDRAGQLHICAETGMMDSAYARELLVGCLFRLRQASPRCACALSERICETVEHVEELLRHLVEAKQSTYAMPWHANVLRGMGRCEECSGLISRALSDSALPESVAKQLRGCRSNVAQYNTDIDRACVHVAQAFPALVMIDQASAASLQATAQSIWRCVCVDQQPETGARRHWWRFWK